MASSRKPKGLLAFAMWLNYINRQVLAVEVRIVSYVNKASDQ